MREEMRRYLHQKGTQEDEMCCENTNRVGRWCNRDTNLKKKVNEFCTAISANQKDAKCEDWDYKVQRGMLELYVRGVQLCEMDRANLVKNLKNIRKAVRRLNEGSEPEDVDELAEKLSVVTKSVRENDWTADEKMEIDAEREAAYTELQPEDGGKIEVEETDEQFAAMSEDGEAAFEGDDMKGYEVGSEETPNSEVYVSPMA